MDGILGKEVQLVVRWQLYQKDGAQLVASEKAEIIESVSGEGFDPLPKPTAEHWENCVGPLQQKFIIFQIPAVITMHQGTGRLFKLKVFIIVSKNQKFVSD